MGPGSSCQGPLEPHAAHTMGSQPVLVPTVRSGEVLPRLRPELPGPGVAVPSVGCGAVSGRPLPAPSPAPFSHTGSALPVTAYDKNGFRILFHFAKECPPGRPDVLVVVVSMLNTAPLPIKSIVLQAAVPKVSPPPGASSCTHVPTPRSTSRALPCLQRSLSLSLVNESEAAATLWDRTLSFQPHPATCSHHTGHAAGQPAEGELELGTPAESPGCPSLDLRVHRLPAWSVTASPMSLFHPGPMTK